MKMATACFSVHLVMCRNAGAAVSIICLREATAEHISTGNQGFAWWCDGACASTAWGLVTETWVLSTWSMQRRFDRHCSITTSTHRGVTDAMSKTTASRGGEEGESKVDPPSDRQDTVGGNTEKDLKNFKSGSPSSYFIVKKGCWQPLEEKQKVDETYEQWSGSTDSGESRPSMLPAHFLNTRIKLSSLSPIYLVSMLRAEILTHGRKMSKDNLETSMTDFYNKTLLIIFSRHRTHCWTVLMKGQQATLLHFILLKFLWLSLQTRLLITPSSVE